MPLLRNCSGKECIRILCNKFNFKAVRQKGSHVVLKKETAAGVLGTVVPMHEELKIGTLKSILELARVAEDEFSIYQ